MDALRSSQTSHDGRTEHAEYNEEEATASPDQRQGLLKALTKALDITAITLPVTLNEPSSFLMRLCEQIQYGDLLDKASQFEDSTQRLLYVAVFAASLFAVAERTGKPFNPLLGETFEYIDEKRNNFKFIAEQVSHHPPIGACYAENDHFIFYQAQQLKTKFTGNSLDCHSLGTSNVIIKKYNEHYQWEGLRTTVHNVIVGKIWLDHHGEMTVVNKTTKDHAIVEFQKCGWFSKGYHEMSGTVFDANGEAQYEISGKWNENIFGKEIPSSRVRSSTLTKKEKKALKKELAADEPIWTHIYKPLDSHKLPCKYMLDWTAHTLEVIAFPEEMAKKLPPTDSRLRPDRLALERTDVKKAAAEKHNLEERQREEARKRRGPWVPRYFKKSTENEHDWTYLENYWQEREARLSKQ